MITLIKHVPKDQSYATQERNHMESFGFDFYYQTYFLGINSILHNKEIVCRAYDLIVVINIFVEIDRIQWKQ